MTTTAPNPSQSRFVAPWVTLVLTLLVLGSTLAHLGYQEHQEIMARERERLKGQTRVMDDNLGRQLEAAHQALVGVREELSAWRRNADWTTTAART